MAEGLNWDKLNSVKNTEDSEIINYYLSDNLKKY